MWQAACQAFPRILEQLRPRYVIVLGREMWRNMPETQLCISEAEQCYALADGSLVRCRALKHPSRGLAWRELAGVIHSYCGA